MTRLLALLVALLALGLFACGEDDSETSASSDTATGTATQSPSEAEQAGCRQVAQPPSKGEQDVKKPDLELDDGKTYVAVVETSCGDFEITLDGERAPKTGGSFVALAKDGFFDGTTFHRIVPGFVIQGGDPAGDGTGGPGYSVIEAPPVDLVYKKGVVAMAKGPLDDPGTSGSQFFVVTGEDAGLPPEYALLGKVTDGLEVVERIGVVETDPTTEAPVSPVVIESVRIRED
jgi:peptidyl-prolyl cis-trans isomerase B (cyclophilin B)